MIERLLSYIPKFAKQQVLVLGDVILDEYIIGNATRISREAPVPVLEFRERRYIPGGAANPSANIISLGGWVIQIGMVGTDSAATHLRQELLALGIDTRGVVTAADRPTTTKTRVLAHMGLSSPQQLARIDTLSRDPISDPIKKQLCDLVREKVKSVNAILLSDYHGGILTPALIKDVLAIAKSSNILITADTQGELDKYDGFDILKCNAADVRNYLGRRIQTDEEFAEAARELFNALHLTGVMVITRGSDGATLATVEGTEHRHAPNVQNVFDTVGAGDTAIAIITLAVAAGASHSDAVTLANYASGIVVQHVGNYAPSPEELSDAVRRHTL